MLAARQQLLAWRSSEQDPEEGAQGRPKRRPDRSVRQACVLM